MTPETCSDQQLLTLRDQLELRREQDDDHRFDWLLKLVRKEISERARIACLEAERRG
jgi:hypothetical protein